jgi:hypothetical protein
MKERGLFNNRGQEGLTLTTLLLIILGIVVVVVVIIGFTTGFDFIFGNIERLPGQSLQAAITSCEIAGENDLKADYCVDLKEVEIDGKEQWVTCEYLRENNYLEGAESASCGELIPNIEEFCINQKLDSDDLVNGVLCSSFSSENNSS